VTFKIDKSIDIILNASDLMKTPEDRIQYGCDCGLSQDKRVIRLLGMRCTTCFEVVTINIEAPK